MATTLVTDSTGTLGVPAAEALRAAGHRVRVLTRTPRADNPEPVGGDPLTGAGIDAVPLRCHRTKLACEALVAGCGAAWTGLRATQFHDLIATMVGGPEVLPITTSARICQAVRHRPIAAVALAGRTAAAFRAGTHTVPDNRYGRITFASWLIDRNGSR